MSRQSDDFVARLVSDPKDPPDLLLLSGYLGATCPTTLESSFLTPFGLLA
jgi:hypothetical protein